MQNLKTSDLEIINAGRNDGDLDALFSCASVAVGSAAFLATGPVSVPLALAGVVAFNIGVIGSGVSAANWLSK